MANISFVHAHNHADVLFVGALDWDAAHELVQAVDTVVHDYFYTEVELVIASPGGDARALEFCLGAFEDCRSRGVRFRTRVVSTAASAGAIMVSLGDERVAEPGARLLYHSARLAHADGITASAIAELHSALREADERIIASLVDRVLGAPPDPARVAYEAERFDREALERLARSPRNARAPNTARRVRGLANEVGRTVERAIRECDRRALARLYRHLFEIETPISARLARTLRLIDRVGFARR